MFKNFKINLTESISADPQYMQIYLQKFFRNFYSKPKAKCIKFEKIVLDQKSDHLLGQLFTKQMFNESVLSKIFAPGSKFRSSVSLIKLPNNRVKALELCGENENNNKKKKKKRDNNNRHYGSKQ